MKNEQQLETLLIQSPQARKELAKNDIEFFASFYLSHHVTSDISQYQKEWIDIINEFQYVALACPRGHGKSTWFSLISVLHDILFQNEKFIILISDTQGQASELLGAIVQELETNERIIRDFGKIAGYIPEKAEEKQKWTASDIITLTGIKVIARGWKSKLRGLKFGAIRPTKIVVDDIENDENVQSEEQRIKVKNVFKKSILNLGDEYTNIVVVGTILHFDSLLMHLLDYPLPGWFTKLYRAIMDNNEVLWPERWTYEKLEAKKAQIGSIEFEQEYMNNPLDPSTQIFSPKEFYEEVDLSLCECFGYIDLAISEKEDADYTAIVTIARHRTTGKLYVIEPVQFRGSILDQLDKVFDLYYKYNYILFGVESVAYQKAFAQILANESSKRKIYVPVVEVEVDKDKVRRAKAITPHIENGTVLFNGDYQTFLAQLIQFPKGSHDDMVDAFVGAVDLAVGKGHSGFKPMTASSSITYPNNY